MYTITWETVFGNHLETRGNEPIPTNFPNGEQPGTPNDEPSDADENGFDYITTRDVLNDVNDAAQSCSEGLIDDVNKINETTEYARIDNSYWPESAVYPKNQETYVPKLSKGQKNNAKFMEGNSSNGNDPQDSPNRGMILSCPKYHKMRFERGS